MNNNIKKIIIALFIFVLSTILIYMTCTINKIFCWCNEYQISLFNTHISDEFILNDLDKNKVNEIGEIIGNYANTLELSKGNKNFEGDKSFYLTENGKNYSIAEQFNPLGYSIWSYMQGELATIFSQYIEISIFFGATISLIYLVVMNNKINYALKFILGYLGILIVVPQIYSYYITQHFGGLEVYSLWTVGFYILYTVVFVLLLFTNYIINARITKKLNKSINQHNQKMG